MATVTTQYKRFQDELVGGAHKVFLAGLGTVKTVGEESGELFDRLVERGRDLETRTRDEFQARTGTFRKMTHRVEGRVDELGDQVDRQITSALHRLGVPTRDEIRTLTSRVEELSRKVDRLAGPAPAVETAGKVVFRVASHEDGWKVEREGDTTPVSVHGTKEQAITAAREIARKAGPSEVIVHKLDGTVQSRFGYGD